MQRHTDNVQNLTGDAVSGVSITVRFTDSGLLAPIFSDNLTVPTPLANPFVNDGDGEFFFYAANSTYDIELSGPVVDSRLSVELFDPDNALIRGPILVGSTPGPTGINLGDVVLVDVTGNAVTVTLPTDPGATFQFADIVVQHVAGDPAINNITIERNGELIGGAASDLVLTITNQAVRLIWAGSTLGWAVQNVGVSGVGATITGVPANDQIGVWVSSTNIEGVSDLTWNGSILTAQGAEIDLDNSASAAAAQIAARNSEGGFALVADGDITELWQTTSAGALEDLIFATINNQYFATYFNGVQVTRNLAAASGGLEINNTLTGAGFERVLTESDATAAQVQEVKEADETVTNTTTYQTDDDIVGMVLAVGRWALEGFMRWNPPTTSGGIKFRWALTGGASGPFSDWSCVWREDVSGSPSVPEYGYSSITGVTGIVLDQVGNAEVTAMFGGQNEVITSARTHDLQWAQATANATGTILRENSWLRFSRTDT